MVAIFYTFVLAALGGGVSQEALTGAPTMATFEILPGLIVAAVWIAINFEKLSYPKGAQHG